eukprot:1363158-Rhodomonas_salina.1
MQKARDESWYKRGTSPGTKRSRDPPVFPIPLQLPRPAKHAIHSTHSLVAPRERRVREESFRGRLNRVDC